MGNPGGLVIAPIAPQDGQDGIVMTACSLSCNLCGSQDVSELSTVDRHKKYLRTVICCKCGLVWTDPRPSNVRQYYEWEYRLDYKKVIEPTQNHVYRAGMVAISRYERIRHLISPALALLDVGSGGGEFIYLLKKLGVHVTGVEPNHGYADYSRRTYDLDVQAGFVQDRTHQDKQFDIISMWHVLEHTEDPFSILCQIRDWLAENGVLIVEVPNVEATCIAPIQRFHRAHLYNFNLESLAHLGARAGYTIANTEASEDGCNITVFFSKGDGYKPNDWPLPGNHERIREIIRDHTNLRHYLSRNPYTRLCAKLRRLLDERRAVAGFNGGRELLDHYYAVVVTDASLGTRPSSSVSPS